MSHDLPIQGGIALGLKVDVTNRLAVVRLDRPDRRNAITLAMWRGLAQIFSALNANLDVRAIILAGTGDDFSVGADISEFAEVRADAAQASDYEAAVDACSEAIYASRCPTIAAVDGYCLGGACHLALACDFRVGGTALKIGIPAARLSIIYGVKSTHRLLSIVGISAAKRILFSADRFSGDDALAMGLIDRLAEPVLATARELVGPMLDSAPLSVAGSKFILNSLASDQSALDLAFVERLIAEAAASDDYREGREAFAAKRKPEFKGA